MVQLLRFAIKGPVWPLASTCLRVTPKQAKQITEVHLLWQTSFTGYKDKMHHSDLKAYEKKHMRRMVVDFCVACEA